MFMPNSGKRHLALVLTFLLGTAGFSGLSFSGANAQSPDELQDKLERLETEVQTLGRAVYSQGGAGGGGGYSGDGGGSPEAANAEVRIQQLETEIRGLTGQIEQQSFEIRQLKEQLEKVTGDMQLRIQDLESGRGAAPAAMSNPPQPSYTTNPSPVPSSQAGEVPLEQLPDENVILDTRKVPYTTQSATGTSGGDSNLGTISQDGYPSSGGGADQAAAAYENAFALLKGGNFDAAEKEFGKFLEQYPNHVLSSNAKYWYGETFYVRGEFEKAARIFAESYQLAPRGAKAHDNLLKLGMSLAGMGNKKDACVALKQLEKETQGAATPVLRRGQQEMQRIGC